MIRFISEGGAAVSHEYTSSSVGPIKREVLSHTETTKKYL